MTINPECLCRRQLCPRINNRCEPPELVHGRRLGAGTMVFDVFPTGGPTPMRRNALIVALAVPTVLTAACGGGGGDGGSGGDDSRPKPIEIPYAQPEVIVDGTPLAGVDPKAYTCDADPGSSVVLMGPQAMDGGIGMTLTKSQPRVVDNFTFTVDGVMYSAKATRPTTTAELSRDGDRYIIKGTAQSYDVEPPLFKNFTATIKCKDAD